MRARHMGTSLIRSGLRVSYIVDDNSSNRAFDRLHPAANVEFISNPRSIGQIARRRSALKRLAPDFVEVLNPHPKTLAPLQGLKRTRIVAMWDEPAIMKPMAWSRGIYERQLARWLVRRASFHLAATRVLKEKLATLYKIRATYSPHAAYLPEYPPTDSPYSGPTAAYMGNFFSLWDHDIILEAARLLSEEGKRPTIWLMGSGPDQEKWQRFINRHYLDNVKLAGHTTGLELWRRLRHAHVLLFPIRNTLTNLTRCPSKTFAYAQAKRPVITNRVGEVAEILGESATYISCDAPAFAKAIMEAFDCPYLADVDYHIEEQNWDQRAEMLIDTITSA